MDSGVTSMVKFLNNFKFSFCIGVQFQTSKRTKINKDETVLEKIVIKFNFAFMHL